MRQKKPMKSRVILIVEEDVLMRQAVANILQRQPGVVIRVCGDLQQAPAKVDEVAPDLVLLSVDGPGTAGEALFDVLRMRHVNLPIAILAPRSPQGAQAALQALQRGAAEVVTKPENNSMLLFAGHHFSKRLPPLLSLVKSGKERLSRADAAEAGGKKSRARRSSPGTGGNRSSGPPGNPVDVVVIGGCSGGVRSLATLVSKLPGDLPVPVVAVQHLPRHFTRELADLLQEQSRLAVEEAWHGAPLRPGTVWIAPGGQHLELYRDGNRPVMRLHRGPREHNARPSIDELFRSAARLYGPRVLALLLSGQGGDGLEGARSVQRHGGTVLVENPFSCLVPDLPVSALREGVAEGSYPAFDLAGQIVQRTAGTTSGDERPGRGLPGVMDLMLFQTL